MNHILNGLLQCPTCEGSLSVADEPGDVCSCPECGASYPVDRGVIDLLPGVELPRGRAQALMESPTMARIYSGMLWRRSFWQGWMLGIQFDPESEIILGAAHIEPTSTVLDVACASGIYTRLFAAAAKRGRVVGLDVSMPMLQQAVSLDRRAQGDNVAYLRASAMKLPLADACFKHVNCCGALHLFPDVEQALGEFVRVLEPGGRVTVGTFRARGSARGRADVKTAKSIGVNMFNAGRLSAALRDVGLTDVHVHHDAVRWMILSGMKQPAGV